MKQFAHRKNVALLDVDGTLLLSNDAHAEAWRRALSEAGVDVSRDRLRRLIGMGGDKLMERVAPQLAANEGFREQVEGRRAELFQHEFLQSVKPAPGARRLLEEMRAEKIRRVVATAAKGQELRSLLQAANVSDLIEGAATSDDASESKPDPDVIEAAMSKYNIVKADAILIGDTPYDIEAGSRAGVLVVALRCGGWSDAELSGAIAIYDDPADLLNHLSSIFEPS